MHSEYTVERRKHRRYIVRGRVRFPIDALEAWGELLNFGHGGMLIRSQFAPPSGTRLPFRILAFCYPNTFAVPGAIVGEKGRLTAIQFLERAEGIEELLQWLERENFPWTGADCTEDNLSPVAAQNERLHRLNQAELQTVEEFIYRQG